MALFLNDNTLVTSCNALLIKSIRIYQEIGELYKSLQVELSNISVCNSQTTVETLNTLLQDARTVDELIGKNLKSIDCSSESTADLVGKRDILINSLYHTNKRIAVRAQNAKSLLRHEIISMSTNRNAINGYKVPETDRKNIVQKFF